MVGGWNFKFEVEGEAQFNRAFNRIPERIQDFTPVWPDVRDAIWKIEREQFKSEGAKGLNGKWASLKPNYAKWKAAVYPNQPILRRTGELEGSLTGPGKGSVVEMKPLEFALGTSIPYAGYHQTGTKHMAQRRVFDFSGEQRTFLMKQMQKGLLKLLKADREISSVFEIKE